MKTICRVILWPCMAVGMIITLPLVAIIAGALLNYRLFDWLFAEARVAAIRYGWTNPPMPQRRPVRRPQPQDDRVPTEVLKRK